MWDLVTFFFHNIKLGLHNSTFYYKDQKPNSSFLDYPLSNKHSGRVYLFEGQHIRLLDPLGSQARQIAVIHASQTRRIHCWCWEGGSRKETLTWLISSFWSWLLEVFTDVQKTGRFTGKTGKAEGHNPSFPSQLPSEYLFLNILHLDYLGSPEGSHTLHAQHFLHSLLLQTHLSSVNSCLSYSQRTKTPTPTGCQPLLPGESNTNALQGCLWDVSPVTPPTCPLVQIVITPHLHISRKVLMTPSSPASHFLFFSLLKMSWWLRW